MKRYFSVINFIWKVLAYVLAALLAALVVVLFYQVICRFLVRAGNNWTQEISTLIFVWATYLGAALAVHSGAQISMTLLLVKTKYPVRQGITLIAALICELFYVLLTWSGIAAMEKFSNTMSAALRLPMSWSYGAIAFSGVVMLLLGTVEIIKPILELKHRNPDSPAEQ